MAALASASNTASKATQEGNVESGKSQEDSQVDLIFDVSEEQKVRARDAEALEQMLADDGQREKLRQFREALSDEPAVCRDTATLIRFLRARNFNLSKSETMLRDMLKWRRNVIPEGGMPMEEDQLDPAVQAEIRKGKLFYLKEHHDLDGRLIFVVRSYLFEKIKTDEELEVCLKALVYLLEWGRRMKRHPLEKVVCLWDQTGASTTWDGYMKQFVDTLQNYYPEGLHACVMAPASASSLGKLESGAVVPLRRDATQAVLPGKRRV